MRIKFGANAAGSGKRVICLSHPTNKEETNKNDSRIEPDENMTGVVEPGGAIS